MKKVYVLLFLFLITVKNNASPGTTLNEPRVLSLELSNENSQTGFQISISKDENGNPLFWVLGEIANSVLPDIANWVCIKIAGRDNEQICDGISEGISLITSLASTGKTIRKFIGSAIEMIAERGGVNSSLRFLTSSLETALNIKSTMEAYQKLKSIFWQSITDNINQFNSHVGFVRIYNRVKRNIVLNFSKDGVLWFEYIFYPGDTKRVDFWEGYLKQGYGFCTGDGFCSYQLFTNKEYQIRYNKLLKQYYLETL